MSGWPTQKTSVSLGLLTVSCANFFFFASTPTISFCLFFLNCLNLWFGHCCWPEMLSVVSVTNPITNPIRFKQKPTISSKWRWVNWPQAGLARTVPNFQKTNLPQYSPWYLENLLILYKAYSQIRFHLCAVNNSLQSSTLSCICLFVCILYIPSFLITSWSWHTFWQTGVSSSLDSVATCSLFVHCSKKHLLW